jgi:hypothetical protein
MDALEIVVKEGYAVQAFLAAVVREDSVRTLLGEEVIRTDREASLSGQVDRTIRSSTDRRVIWMFEAATTMAGTIPEDSIYGNGTPNPLRWIGYDSDQSGGFDLLVSTARAIGSRLPGRLHDKVPSIGFVNALSALRLAKRRAEQTIVSRA